MRPSVLSRGLRQLIALEGSVRKESQVIWRYKVPLAALSLTAFLVPLSYYAQAQGFSGEDDRALEAFSARAGTDEVAGFLYLGWAVFLWVSLILWGPGSALREERRQGSLEVVLLTPVSRLVLLLGPAIAQVIPTVVLFSTVGVVLRFVFGFDLGAAEILRGLVVVVASLPVLFAVGAIVGVLTLAARDSGGVADAVYGLVAVLCGVTYPIAVLPEWLQPVSRALPFTQIIDDLRNAVLSLPPLADTAPRAASYLLVGVAAGALALLLLRTTMRRAQRTGRLVQF